jgi:zona occludens toxin (predicted ATPase)
MRRFLLASALALLATAGAATPALAEDQRTRLALDEVTVERAPADSLTGAVVVKTPLPAFARLSEDGAPAARFEVDLGAPCRADVRVGTRALKYRRSPRRQIYAATDGDDGTLAKDWRPLSPWRLTEEPGAVGIRLFGIRVIRLAPRRFLHVRVTADYDDSCPDVDRREGIVPAGLAKILRSARLRGSLVRG